jgi:hypothetical protein
MNAGDWVVLVGVVVTAVFGVTTVVFTRRAERAQANARKAARDSTEAAQRSADAQQAIAGLLETSQANLVLIEPDHDMRGKPGFVLRNNSDASIFKVEVKPWSDDANLWGWDVRGDPEKIEMPLVADSLKSGQATRVWIPTLNKAKLAIDHIRVTFDDASGQSWQRIGNGPPVKK